MAIRNELLYSIGEVAREVRVSPATIRIWEREKLLQPQRTRGKHRLYSQADLERLQRICHLRRVERLNVAAIRRDLGAATAPSDGPQPAPDGRRELTQGLGQRLRALRAQHAMTLGEVAHRTQLSASFLSAVECGKSGISMGNLL